MTPHAQAVWSALEFRKPMLIRNVEPLGEDQMCWRPAPGRQSVAWQLWHIAEVEDNWIRTATVPIGTERACARAATIADLEVAADAAEQVTTRGPGESPAGPLLGRFGVRLEPAPRKSTHVPPYRESLQVSCESELMFPKDTARGTWPARWLAGWAHRT